MNAATVGAQQQTQQHPTHQPEEGTTMSSIVSAQSSTRCQSWCVDHDDGGKFPEDAFCRSERVEIAGIETHLSDGTLDDAPKIFVQQVHGDSITPAQAAALAARLNELSVWITAPEVALAMREGHVRDAIEAAARHLNLSA